MGDSLDRIFDRMCEIIHRIDTPFISGVVVCHAGHTVDHRIAHIDVRRVHIDLRTEYFFSVLIFALAHLLE